MPNFLITAILISYFIFITTAYVSWVQLQTIVVTGNIRIFPSITEKIDFLLTNPILKCLFILMFGTVLSNTHYWIPEQTVWVVSFILLGLALLCSHSIIFRSKKHWKIITQSERINLVFSICSLSIISPALIVLAVGVVIARCFWVASNSTGIQRNFLAMVQMAGVFCELIRKIIENVTRFIYLFILFNKIFLQLTSSIQKFWQRESFQNIFSCFVRSRLAPRAPPPLLI